MIKPTVLAFVFALTCFVFPSFISETLPDPAMYSKKLIETIKHNNQDFYIQTFQINDTDLDWLKKTALANPYLSESEKLLIQEDIGKNAEELNNKLKERLNRNFEQIQDWILRDSINVNNIEYVTFYYDLEFKRRSPFYVLDDGELFIKHGTKFYKISLDNIIFINNQWKYGEINDIDEVDEHLNYISNNEYDEYSEYAVDSVAVVEPAYDTAAAVVYDYYAEPYYPELTEKQTKKADKIQKKIDALLLQKDKIYQSGY